MKNIKNYNDFINEKLEQNVDVKGKVERSKKIPKELKEEILPLINSTTRYNNGIVVNLTKPHGKQSIKGCGLGADKNGFFVMTHRARSKSYKNINDIPQKEINFIESTG